MNYLEFLKKQKNVLIVVGIILAFVLFWIFSGSKTEITPSQEGVQPTTQETAPSGKAPSASSPTQKKVATPARPSIAIVTPFDSESWLLGKTHTIRWSREEGHNGVIVLLDAATKSIVGWITSNLSAQQVTYDWDTRYVSLGRTDPSRKNISAGTYVIRVAFDSSNLKIESAPFQIIETGVEKILLHNVFIRELIFIPNSLNVKKGERVAITNDDNNNIRTILLSGVAVAKLSPRDSYVFDTAKVSAGSYEFKLAENVVAKLTVNVSQ